MSHPISPTAALAGGPFRFRNAIGERDDVASELLGEGADTTKPFVTIGITTYRRPDFLVEAVQSALAQEFDRPLEILVVDDDPASTSAELLLKALPVLRERNFRYYRHTENLGIYHNFNRILKFAKGEWLTILNDDDFLDHNYLSLMFAELDTHAEFDGIICHKRTLDQRDGAIEHLAPTAPAQHPSRRLNVRAALRMLARPGARGEFAKTVMHRLVFEGKFRGRTTRRIPARKLFWGSILGTGCGFIFRTRCAIEIGGFYQDETPASDYWFYTRFAKLYHMRQHRAAAATMRKAANETARRENVRLSFQNAYGIQRALAQEDVPSWWLRLSPLVLAWHRADFRTQWRVDLSPEEIKQATQVEVAQERPRLLFAIRLLLRGL